MKADQLAAAAAEFIRNSPQNRITSQQALSSDCAGLEMMEAPIFGYAKASHHSFGDLAMSAEAGVPLLLPEQWLPGAKTVISFFVPFTKAVRESNRQQMDYPSNQWFHARIEGQALLGSLCRHLVALLEEAGYPSVVPALDSRFSSGGFTSNWSERHVAHLCGLGTFSLSRGLITAKGVAGRFGSVVTTLELPPTVHGYTGLTDYCNQCGACARNCPAHAIDRVTGKHHQPCSDFLDSTQREHDPYYGCGKCQVKVPCESGIPAQS